MEYLWTVHSKYMIYVLDLRNCKQTDMTPLWGLPYDADRQANAHFGGSNQWAAKLIECCNLMLNAVHFLKIETF